MSDQAMHLLVNNFTKYLSSDWLLFAGLLCNTKFALLKLKDVLRLLCMHTFLFCEKLDWQKLLMKLEDEYLQYFCFACLLAISY